MKYRRIVKPKRMVAYAVQEKKKSDPEEHQEKTLLPLSVFQSALGVIPLRCLVELLNYFEHVKPELIFLLQHDNSIDSKRLLRCLKTPLWRDIHSVELDQLRSSIDHDCAQVRLAAIKRLVESQDLEGFQLICWYGLIDADIEVRLGAVKALHHFDHFAGQVLCTLNRKDTSCSISGMFVCALEDEFMQIRRATLKVLEQFSLKNNEFAKCSIDHIADMLNDEIEAVRLQAIHSIRNILDSNKATSERLDMTDFVGLLSTLEDGSFTVRSAFRGILQVIIVDSAQTLRSIVNEGLLKNLKRYPEDKKEIWHCAAELGRNHENLTVLLHSDMLAVHSFLTPSEPDIDDPYYVTVLVFLVNGLFASNKHWTSSFNIPFLDRHIQALRIMDRMLLPETIRYLKKSVVHSQTLLTECEHLLNRAVRACCAADQQKSYEKLCKCVDVLDTLRDTSLEDVAAFYQAQARLRACVYGKQFNEEYLRPMAYGLLSTFENVDGIPNLVELVKRTLTRRQDLPPFVVLPQEEIHRRIIIVGDLNQETRKVGAGLALHIRLHIELKYSQPWELFACVELPNGRTEVHFIGDSDKVVNDSCGIIIHTRRPWTSPAMVKIRLGCLLDEKYLDAFELKGRSAHKSRLIRFVPLSNDVMFKMQVVDVMF